MGCPIYVILFFYEGDSNQSCIKSQLVVVDEEETTVKVTFLNLPDLGRYMFLNSGFAVAKSRLFIVGVSDLDESEEEKSEVILSFNFQQKKKMKRKKNDTHTPTPTPTLCWETVPVPVPDGGEEEEFCFRAGTPLSEDGDLIYWIGSGGNLYTICSETMAIKINRRNAIPIHGNSIPSLLALTDNKIYVNCFSPRGDGLLGYYDLLSKTWHTINDKSRLDHLAHNVVVVKNLYLISFALYHPVTDALAPALYVYDLRDKKWLTEPVHGLQNNDIVLPSLKAYHPQRVCRDDPSLTQLCNDELKFALVWNTVDRHNTNDFRVTKFLLKIQQHNGAPPTFQADQFSYARFFTPNSVILANITA